MQSVWSLQCTRCRPPVLQSFLRTLLTTFRFGIEFAPEVVQADGTVRNLAWRICNAKKVLVSYSHCYGKDMCD